MNRKPILIAGFIIMVLAQLYVPGSMIMSHQSTLEQGHMYKFRTEPVDPTDPFRGKYVSLTYRNTQASVPAGEYYAPEETVYVTFTEDSEGFAKIDDVLRSPPEDTEYYLMTQVSYAQGEFGNIVVEFPFDRFYMEESKAYEAEKAHREAMWDEQQNTYALVAIKEGNAVIQDVYINDISLKETVQQRLSEQE
ncbi:GDYXXLXY domain-containing protein [Roseivirga sp. BDSF3-8]|uniref:GDYXXLXY domain-containing protein n=1 Tax=Roseivirga sp. BDSF3-8 TaxID=3241598 RepID=UPI00353247BD